MTSVKTLAFTRSDRKDSFNKKLVKIAIIGAKVKGAKVSLSDIR